MRRSRTKVPVNQLVQRLKDNDQDLEWYPTTDLMLLNVQHDIRMTLGKPEWRSKSIENYPHFSLLDIGAGNGKVLDVLGNGDKYLIEKSPILVNQNNIDNMVLGTDFNACSLIDKKVDVIFCNPPYSEYVQWVIKIIKEANCQIIYLVIPDRWKDNTLITKEMKRREVEPEILFTGDFLSAERRARARVDIIKLDLCSYEFNGKKNRGEQPDPFNIWFETEFQGKDSNAKDYGVNKKAETFEDKIKNQLTTGRNIIDILVEMYDIELNHIHNTYKKISSIDFGVMKEMNISASDIKGFLKSKIKNTKYKYWEKLFEEYTPISERLTSKTKNALQQKIFSNTGVEFNVDNAYAITGWVIRNANRYYDSQLITFFQQMMDECNIIKYKSNKNTFGGEGWRWLNRSERREKTGKVKLEYRIVCSEGGISSRESYYHSNKNGLSENADTFINDCLVIANNIGFSTGSSCKPEHHEKWVSRVQHTFRCVTPYEQNEVLMEIRAYKNGNMHIKFNQDFMKRLNIIHGKLVGWIKKKEDIVDDMGMSQEDADTLYQEVNYRILGSDSIKLLGAK